MVSSPALEDLRQIISNYITIKMKVNGVQCFVSLNGQFFIYIYISSCVFHRRNKPHTSLE